jgi:glycosyltransferase involved in cell wall biosynthesis
MLNHNFAGQGTYWRCLHLGRALAARGHDVTLFTRHPSARFRARRRTVDGVEIVETPLGVLGRLHLGEWGLLDIGLRVLHLLRRRPDVLMAFSQHPDIALPFFVSRALRLARVHHADRDDLQRGALLETAFRGTRLEWSIPLGERWERALPAAADAVTTISAPLRDEAIAWGLDPAKVLLLPSGADAAARPTDRASARAATGLPADAPVAVYMTSGGGGDVRRLPAAVARAAARVPDALFVCLGPPQDALELDRVLQPGLVPAEDVPVWLAAADVAMMPFGDLPAERAYNAARWPIKLGEYMAAGLAVVACDIGETARVVRKEGIGVVARADMSDFGDRLADLLLDRERARALGANARLAAEERYDWRTLAERLERFLRERGAP